MAPLRVALESAAIKGISAAGVKGVQGLSNPTVQTTVSSGGANPSACDSPECYRLAAGRLGQQYLAKVNVQVLPDTVYVAVTMVQGWDGEKALKEEIACREEDYCGPAATIVRDVAQKPPANF